MKGNTITIKVDRQVESFTFFGDREKLYDEIKWRAYSKGISFDHPQLVNLRRELGL